MTAITCTVAFEKHRLSAEHPLAVAVAISTVGQVVHLLAVGFH